MPTILQDYLPIIVFMGLSIFITLLLILPPILIAPKNLTQRNYLHMSVALTPLMTRDQNLI